MQNSTGLQDISPRIQTHVGDINPIFFANPAYQEGFVNQLPFIYSAILGAYYSDKQLDDIIFNIESEFEIILKKFNL